MAYCNECGAYIPDGRTKCLACGYDAAEAEKSGEGDEAKRSEPSGGQGRGAQGEAIGDSEGDGNDLLWFAASLLSGGA